MPESKLTYKLVETNQESECYLVGHPSGSLGTLVWYKKGTVILNMLEDLHAYYQECGVLHNLEGYAIKFLSPSSIMWNGYYIDGAEKSPQKFLLEVAKHHAKLEVDI